MRRLAYGRRKNKRKEDLSSKEQGQLTISISFDQSIFKRKLTHVVTNEFVMSLSMKKEARVMQSKRFPIPCIDLELHSLLDGVNMFHFYCWFLGKLYMSMLKQMGGCFALW